MTTKEIIDALLKLLELIISWPTLFLLVGVVFYKDVKEAMPSLLKRIRKAPGGWEFDEELQEVKAEVAELINKNEIEKDSTVLKVDPHKIHLTHTSTPLDGKYWSVTAKLEAPEDFMSLIERVEFERHPTFKNRTHVVREQPFVDKIKCWGAFTMKAHIYLNDGQVIKRQRFLTLSETTD